MLNKNKISVIIIVSVLVLLFSVMVNRNTEEKNLSESYVKMGTVYQE